MLLLLEETVASFRGAEGSTNLNLLGYLGKSMQRRENRRLPIPWETTLWISDTLLDVLESGLDDRKWTFKSSFLMSYRSSGKVNWRKVSI